MGHPQPPNPMQAGNTFAVGFSNGTVEQKRSKAIDMQFYWIWDRSKKGQFIIYWWPGTQNLGDYHTKHHSPSHNRQMRPTHLNETENMENNLISKLLRGCIDSVSSCRAWARWQLHNHLRQNPDIRIYPRNDDKKLRQTHKVSNNIKYVNSNFINVITDTLVHCY